ncbi:MAG: TonB-dependent receptor [Bacteroidia bacterium]|nr:TonB-dependent receptor [Bacteroidia bacterium]
MNPSFTDRFCSLRLFLLVSLLSLSTYTYSQTLSGRIADEDTREALGFASVTVLSLPDSSEVGGTLTDIDGVFTLSLEPGTYLLAMRFLGYQPVVKGPIELKKGQITDFGLIGLFQRQVSIDEVEITSQVTQMELDLDKRVYRVDQDLSLAGSSASEILQNLPSVQVDPEGAVSLRGSQNVRILINGRPSGLTEGLQLMQGNMIEKIEVITNPSARYDAEGEAGIINIILKKEKEKGFNGAFTLGTGWPQNHNLGANVNYRSGKINWFANIGSNYRSGPGGGGYYQEEYENGETSLITEQDNQRIRSSLGGNFRTGADLIFNDYNTLTVSGLLSYDDEENLTNIVYRDFTSEKVLSQTTTRDQVEAESDKNVEFQSTYRKTFPQKDREWVSTVQYQLNDDLELGDITQQTNGGEILYQRSSNTEDEANWLIQSDYIHPFGKEDKFRLETGTRITLRSIENDYLVEEQNIGGAWAALPDFDNRFNYEENIYAGYGIFSQKLDKFGYQLGLRAEYTDLSASLLNASADIQKNYLNWFPSAFFSYKVNQENTLQLSYSRRLSRPGFRSLLPFSSFSDARNLRIGNPDLDPEYTHSFELGYLAYWESGAEQCVLPSSHRGH